MKDAFACQQLVENHAEAEDVAAMIDGQTSHLFRTHVARRAHDDAGFGAEGYRLVGSGRTGGLHLRQSKIQDLGTPVAGQQDVVWLQVAMHDAGIVRCSQSAGDLHGDVDGLADPQFAAAQRLALHQFADDVPLAHVVDGDDVGVIQRRHGARLLFEALAAQNIVRHFVRQNLQRHFAIQACIARDTLPPSHQRRAARRFRKVRACRQQREASLGFIPVYLRKLTNSSGLDNGALRMLTGFQNRHSAPQHLPASAHLT